MYEVQVTYKGRPDDVHARRLNAIAWNRYGLEAEDRFEFQDSEETRVIEYAFSTRRAARQFARDVAREQETGMPIDKVDCYWSPASEALFMFAQHQWRDLWHHLLAEYRDRLNR